MTYDATYSLAAGCSRSSEVDYARFVEIATGSLFEVVAQATIGRNQEFLDQSGYQQVYDAAEMQIRMLSGMRQSLNPSQLSTFNHPHGNRPTSARIPFTETRRQVKVPLMKIRFSSAVRSRSHI